jgi:hypothetical protein
MTDTQHAPMEATPVSSRSWYMPFLYGVGVVLVLLALGVYAYTRFAVHSGSSDGTITRLAEVFRVRGARVDGTSIFYADVQRDVAALKKYYTAVPTNFGSPTEEEIRSQALSRRMANIVVERLAKEYKVSVSAAELDAAFDEQIAESGTEREAAKKQIQELYGMSFSAFKTNALYPLLLEEKVREAYLVATGEDAKVRASAEAVLARAKAGDDFAALAAEFGTDSTKNTGGDLGYFAKGQMVEPFDAAVFSASVGSVIPDLVRTDYGYHIIKVEDKTTTTTPQGETQEVVRARHILFLADPGDIFRGVIVEKLIKADVEIYVDTWVNPFASPAEGAPVLDDSVSESDPTEEGGEASATSTIDAGE